MYIIQLLNSPDSYFTSKSDVLKWNEITPEDCFSSKRMAIEEAQLVQDYEGEDMVKLYQVDVRHDTQILSPHKISIDIPNE